MERDLNGFPVPSDYQVTSRRDALEMAAMVQDAIATGTKVRRIEPVDLTSHKPRSKWARKDGTTGQRETWRRELSGHKAGRQRKARNAKESA